MRGIITAALGLTATILAGCTPPKAPPAPNATASSAARPAAPARPEDTVRAAEAYVKAALGSTCDMNDRKDIPLNATDQDGVSHFVYKFSYKLGGDDAGAPPHEIELYQMFCAMGAYNIQSVFLLRDPDSGQEFQLLSFARPDTSYDYTDDTDTKLKAPPVVTGFASDITLTNAKFDPKTMTISSRPLGRGVGDLWEAGQWRFSSGEFQLVRYEIDPTEDGGSGQSSQPESYVVYQAGP